MPTLFDIFHFLKLKFHVTHEMMLVFLHKYTWLKAFVLFCNGYLISLCLCASFLFYFYFLVGVGPLLFLEASPQILNSCEIVRSKPTSTRQYYKSRSVKLFFFFSFFCFLVSCIFCMENYEFCSLLLLEYFFFYIQSPCITIYSHVISNPIFFYRYPISIGESNSKNRYDR